MESDEQKSEGYICGGNQSGFLVTCHPLDLQLSAAGGTASVTGLHVGHFQRAASPEVLGTAPVAMLQKTPLRIDGDPGVQRIIRAEDDVHVPGHGLCIVMATLNHYFQHSV